MNKKHYTFFERLCLQVDNFVRVLGNNPQTSGRPYPLSSSKLNFLSAEKEKQAAALMRVNHAGEICAQALYQGQALISRDAHTRDRLLQAAIEEGDHLAWCQQRLKELSSHPSYLNPIWYSGSLFIGMLAGLAGDRWSLGFLAETEKQVINHLQTHLNTLPIEDYQSYAILAQMKEDEAKHRQEALAMGAATLPRFVQQCMGLVSKIMVKTAYWI